MTKARHLRKPTASTNSEFAPICLARLALSEGGACNRTSSRLVTAGPRGVGSQPKSRCQAYRNGNGLDEGGALRSRPNRSHAVRRIETDLRASPRRQVDSVPTEVTPSGEADASLNEHADSAIGTRSTKFV